MNFVILGAGVIGVTTAYYLRKLGHDVTVIDRNQKLAAECSFANGGQLSFGHVEPWANLDALKRLPYWLFTSGSPLSVKGTPNLKTIGWVASFLRHCSAKKVHQTSEQLWHIAQQSQQEFSALHDEFSIDDDYKKTGTLHIFSSPDYLRSFIRHADWMKSLGCQLEILPNRKACEQKEPLLADSTRPIAGGVYFADDYVGDVHKFVQFLGQKCKHMGVTFKLGVNVNELQVRKGQLHAIGTSEGDIAASNCVVAMGAYSQQLVARHGIKLSMYPLKGYSLTIPTDESFAPNCAITDHANKVVYSSLGSTLRVAGMADMFGFNHEIVPSRVESLVRGVENLFPQINVDASMAPWSCLRPSTASGVPYMGKTVIKGLYMNTGHGSLGWTLSLGSASMLAQIIAND